MVGGSIPAIKLGENFSIPLEIDGRGTPMILVGTMGSGKTVLGKEIACLLRELNYKVLIISPVPEEHYLSRFRVPSNDCFRQPLNGLKRVRYGDFGWLPSDFDFLDWQSLKLAEGGAGVLADLSRKRSLHNDSVETFLSLVSRLPSEYVGMSKWNREYGKFWFLESPFPASTISSLRMRFRHVKESFLLSDERVDFVGLLKDFGSVVVEIPFFGRDADLLIMRCHVSLILKQFCNFKVLNGLGKFCVIIDEADKVCRVERDGLDYGSQVRSIELIKKFNKAGCCSPVFLVQDLFNISEELWRNCKVVLLGSGGVHPVLGLVNKRRRGAGAEKWWLVVYDNLVIGWFRSLKSWVRYVGYDLRRNV